MSLFNTGQAVYNPGRVTDLQVTAVNYTRQTVTLEWTAMGNELDQGQGTWNIYFLSYQSWILVGWK